MLLIAIFVLSGLALLFWPRTIVRRERQRRAKRLADLRKDNAESFFEERRSLETYPVTTTPGILRMVGAGAILIGIVSALSGRF
jgi:hypothetical protein